MSETRLNRRDFLRASAMTAVGMLAASCAQPTPQVIEKPVTVVVEKAVPVEKQVVQTVVVEKAVPVEKVVKETVVVEKEVPVEKVIKQTVVQERVVEKVVTPTPLPAKYKEAPMLTELVKAGKLPPVDERLPAEPLVVTPVEEIGTYGGTWRLLHMGAVDVMQLHYPLREFLAKSSPDFTEVVPNVAKAWEFTDNGKAITIYLRRGMKWSDGAPFTADDVMYWYQDVVLNDDLSPTKPANLKRSGELAVFKKLDDYAFKIIFADLYGAFEDFLPTMMPYQPGHYLKQFHAAYASQADLEAAMKKGGFDNWTALYGSKTALSNNPGTPDIWAWIVQNSIEDPVQTLERNPYYWKVDTAGNQLPYLDKVERTLLPDAEAILLKAIAGDTEYQDRRVSSLGNRPVVVQNAEKGGYRVIPTISPNTNYGTIYFNYAHKDEFLRELFNKLEFRIAFSVAINRDEINQLVYKGLATPSAATCAIGTPWYEERFRTAYIEYDPDKANKLLDDLGLTKRDAEGYRLRPDGKRLSLINLTFTPWPAENVEVQELVKGYLKDVGIEMIVKPTDRQLWVTQVQAGEHDLASYASNLGFAGNPPMVRTETFLVTYHHWAPPWALWHQTNGAEGVEPPEEVKKLQSLYEQVLAETSAAKRIELQKQALALHAENIWQIGLHNEPDAGRFTIAKNNFRNVPEVAHDIMAYHTATFFIKK